MAHPTPLHHAAAQAGAVFTEEGGWSIPAHFGDPNREYEQARSGCVVFDQSHRGKLQLTGREAARFLHNLTTQDVLNLPPGEGREAFALTAKARVVAYFLLFHQKTPQGESAYWLNLPPGAAETTLKHLDRYHVSEQVDFQDRTHDFFQLHLTGPQAAAVLEKTAGAALPQLKEMKDLHYFRLPLTPFAICRHDVLGTCGFDMFGPTAALAEAVWEQLTPTGATWPEALWNRLKEAGAAPAGREAFETLRIEAGTPAFGPDLDENTFAPEVGRAAQAISYTKGCYLGQEPIVMARDRGQVNRALLGLKLTGGSVPHGCLVYRDGKEIGRVTSSVASPRLGPIALAYIRRGSQESGTAVEVEVERARRPAVVSALPFTG
ncbi:MAG TPA: aminomethyltransferase family protein [Gemmataceae bacterium]|nr:aminomethyltransferase family protein [Gemmataceae bacterium]